MIRSVRLALLVLLLAAWSSGCGNAPRDQIPTKMQTPPREPPASGESGFFPTQKK
jgi:hypothetical protein